MQPPRRAGTRRDDALACLRRRHPAAVAAPQPRDGDPLQRQLDVDAVEERPGQLAEIAGSWLRDGPLAPEPAVRRPLDDALQRGALTLRGFDRVLRVAWSNADLAGRDRLEVSDIGRALYLKRGARA